MGKEAYRKEKDYKAAVKSNRRFPAWCSSDRVNRLKVEWENQERIDEAAKQKEIDYYKYIKQD